MACIQKLGLDLEKVNPVGGAIAFGHPYGCSKLTYGDTRVFRSILLKAGVRQVATGLHELQRREGKILCTSMCKSPAMFQTRSHEI